MHADVCCTGLAILVLGIKQHDFETTHLLCNEWLSMLSQLYRCVTIV